MSISAYSGNGNGSKPVISPDFHAAAHELRTPLTVILGYAELLRLDDVWLDERKRDQMLASIITNVRNELQIIEEWIEGDIDGPRTNDDAAVVLLRDEAAGLIDSIAPLLRENDVRLDVSPQLYVVAEKQALREILSNLLTNAAKYSKTGTKITVGAIPAGEYVTVNVHNEGNGLAVGDLNRIFEREYRVSPNGDQPGYGLGLSIAHALVTRLGGRIWAASGARGTNFAFTVPAALT